MFADLPPLLVIHSAAALVALPVGAVQLTAEKGTGRHRMGGYVYAVAMLVAIVSALLTWPDRTFLFFYILALVSLVTLVAGMGAMALWRRTGEERHLQRHRVDMAFSWLGLLMAGASQVLVNPRFGIAPAMDPIAFWGLFAAVNLALYAWGSWWIFNRLVHEPGRSE